VGARHSPSAGLHAPGAHHRCCLSPLPLLQPSTFAQAPAADAAVADPLPPRAAQKEYKPLTPEDLVDRPEYLQKIADYKLPQGYHWYETMIVLRAMMDDKGR